MARVPASLFPIYQGKTWDPWQTGKLHFYPSLWARKLCSNSLYFFIFSGHCYDTICWVREILLLWWWFASWMFYLGAIREKKILIGTASVQYTGQKCVLFYEPCCKGWLLWIRAWGTAWGWNKEHFIVLQPALYCCATTSTVAGTPAQACVFTSAGTEDAPRGNCWWIW